MLMDALPFADDDARWRAVAARDPAAADAFVCAVATTGIYCRPTCSARPARRNVTFYPDAAAAEAAGFRACKLCLPEGPGRHAEAVARACRAMEAAETPPDLEALARGAGLSSFHFHRVFRAVTGVTPKAYAAGVQARRARAALEEGLSATEAAYAAGFGAASRFYAAAPGRLGMTPGQYRAGGRDVTLRIAIGRTSLGLVLVAVTDVGIAAIQLGSDAEQLTADLAARFPGARLEVADEPLANTVAAVAALVEDPGAAFDLPLDVRGTAFQEQVWQALRAIPAGKTLTYGELAAAIGRPTAVRAVAAACGANRVAVVIPCHRVIGADGTLTGYRWGVDRKAELLRREGAGDALL